jgi:hypothetical protein
MPERSRRADADPLRHAISRGPRTMPSRRGLSNEPLPGPDIARFVPLAGYVALTFFAMPMAALSRPGVHRPGGRLAGPGLAHA